MSDTNIFASQVTKRQKEQEKIEKQAMEGDGYVKPKRITFAMSMTEDDKKWIKIQAAKEGTTVAGLFHKMVELYKGER